MNRLLSVYFPHFIILIVLMLIVNKIFDWIAYNSVINHKQLSNLTDIGVVRALNDCYYGLILLSLISSYALA